MTIGKKYNKQILEELIRRHPELSYDMEIIAAKLEPEEWEPMTDSDKNNLRKYFERCRDKNNIEKRVQSTCRYNDPAYIHELSDEDLIERLADWYKTPQGKPYMKWLSIKYSKEDRLILHYSDHDSTLSLDEARKKYAPFKLTHTYPSLCQDL
jgi:hypothetical protein